MLCTSYNLEQYFKQIGLMYHIQHNANFKPEQ